MDLDAVRKRIIFHGRVQGVGFRFRARYLAQSLGLTGWVKNQYDGTVLMEVQGRSHMIDELLIGLRKGDYIDIEWIDMEEISTESEFCFHAE